MVFLKELGKMWEKNCSYTSPIRGVPTLQLSWRQLEEKSSLKMPKTHMDVLKPRNFIPECCTPYWHIRRTCGLGSFISISTGRAVRFSVAFKDGSLLDKFWEVSSAARPSCRRTVASSIKEKQRLVQIRKVKVNMILLAWAWHNKSTICITWK